MITLDFVGPLKFCKTERYLFESEFVRSEGIYIWTIKDEINGKNYVHYIGETNEFGKRQKEHFLQITGLNYRIIDAGFARQGIEKIIWNGLWRDKSKNAVANLLDNYNEVSKKVVEYIEIINVYFAPTHLDTEIRKHIEGCLGYDFRKKYPERQIFYPADNHLAAKSKRLKT